MNLSALKTLYQSDIKQLQLSPEIKDFKALDNIFLKDLSNQCKTLGLFENKTGENKTSFSQFWEDYLALFLVENNIDLKRDKRDGAPDYYFEAEGKKIHIEAKAPNDADDAHRKLKTKDVGMTDALEQISDEDSFEKFEASLAEPNNTLLRFTGIIHTTLKEQIKNSFLKSGAITQSDYIILAINGHEVVKSTEYYGCFAYHIICSLFEMNGNQSLNTKSNKIVMDIGKLDKIGKPIGNNYFCSGNQTPIDGILYSNVHLNAGLLAEEFVFIPNPEREDISRFFPLCSVFLISKANV